MAYGGGTWLTQNKILPGAYINFSSVARASATISDRGVAAAPFELSWGEEGVVKLVEQGDFLKDCFNIFGYSYSAPEMVHLREIFKHATKCYCYRLPTAEGSGATAQDEGAFVTAKYKGKRGNDIRVNITVGTNGMATVKTIVGTREADKQVVSKWVDLTDTKWVTFTKSKFKEVEKDPAEYVHAPKPFDENKTYYELVEHEQDVDHEETWTSYEVVLNPVADNIDSYYVKATVMVEKTVIFSTEAEQGETGDHIVTLNNGARTLNLTGGADGNVNGDSYDQFIESIEPFAFNTLCCPVDGEENDVIVGQFINFTRRMRDDVGAKFQLVCHKPETADYEGVIGLWNDVTVGDSDVLNKASLTYWLTGAEAGCNINESLTNTKYDGELDFLVNTKQSELEEHIEEGHLVFHQSNGDIVILTDINSLVTLRENFGQMFQHNQTIRVCDQIANDLALLFVKRYLGIVQNDESGRASWWNECVVYFTEMQRLRAITEFAEEIVEVDIGNTKDTVLTTINGLNIVNAMEKLYMSVICQ